MSGGSREELDFKGSSLRVNALCYHLGLFGGKLDLGCLSGELYAGPETGR